MIKGMMIIRMGDKYPDQLPPTEGLVLELFKEGGSRAFLNLYGLSVDEYKALNNTKNSNEIGVYVDMPAIFMILKIDGVGEFDAPLNMHLYEGKYEYPELITPNSRLNIDFCAVSYGIVKAIRLFTVNPGFSKGLIAIAKQQLKHSKKEVDDKIQYVMNNVPIQDLCKMAKFVKWGS